MRVNEENFATGDKEDVEPSYVEQIVGNHNQDEGAHPDIRKQITDTQAFYQNAKDRVEGVAETAVDAQTKAVTAAENAGKSEVAAEEAKSAAVDAKGEAKTAAEVAYNYMCEAFKAASDATIAQQAAETARETAVRVYPRIIDGYWHVWDWVKGDVVNSGVPATGPNGEQGEKGEPGPQGEKGADGYTPQRGVDYWTDGDKAEIVDVVKGYVDEKTEPFVITFEMGMEETDTGYVSYIFGDKTFDEVKEALEQGKSFVGCNLWGQRVNFTVVPDMGVSNIENAISLVALTGNLTAVTCTCWKDLYSEKNGWNVEQESVVTVVNKAIQLGVLDSWEVAV